MRTSRRLQIHFAGYVNHLPPNHLPSMKQKNSLDVATRFQTRALPTSKVADKVDADERLAGTQERLVSFMKHRPPNNFGAPGTAFWVVISQGTRSKML